MRSHHRSIRLALLESRLKNAIRAAGAPVFVGDGVVDYLCGACGVALCTGMREGDLEGIVFACACGASNRVGGAENDPCAGWLRSRSA